MYYTSMLGFAAAGLLFCAAPGSLAAQQRSGESPSRYRYSYEDDHATTDSRPEQAASRQDRRLFGDRAERQQRVEGRLQREPGPERRFSRDGSDTRGQDRSRADQESQHEFAASAQSFIEQYDQNDDGQLSRKELPGNLRQDFDRLDRNGDNRLSAGELREHAGRMAQRTTAIVPVEITYVWIVDATQGRLKLEDLQQAYQTLQEIDQNGDQQISRSELNARRQEIVTQWARKAIERCDEDGDGQLDRQEAANMRLQAHFEQLDRNNDDSISRSELQHLMAQRAGMPQDSQTASQERDQARDQARDQDRDEESTRAARSTRSRSSQSDPQDR